MHYVRTDAPGGTGYEIAVRAREYAAREDRRAREVAQQAQADIAAGRFGAASFVLANHISEREALARYIPPDKLNAIRAVAGISLWPRPQDGKVFGRLTVPFDMYSFLPGFYKRVEAPLTEREQRLVAFGQMTPPPAREVYDVAALSAWFTNHLGVDARERQFLFSEKVVLPASRYVDREQWVLWGLADVVPAHRGSAWLKFGAFGLPGTQLALVPVNRPTSAAKITEPVVIPMKYDDARCQEMMAYYRFYPVAHGGGETAIPAQGAPDRRARERSPPVLRCRQKAAVVAFAVTERPAVQSIGTPLAYVRSRP